MIDGVQVVGFDADDTLWMNETYFLETEEKLRSLLSPYVDGNTVSEELYRTETHNMSLYGYGVKAYLLSMLETTIRITNGQVPATVLEEIIRLGKEQLTRPVELLDGVEETLNALVGRYRLILVTKGDLLDQEQKLRRSGLEHLFHHVEIMSDKTDREYRLLLKHLDIRPDEFLMIGNSVRSDILPPLRLGSYAVHIPYHTTWLHEQVDEPVVNPRFHRLDTLWEVISLLP